MRRSARFTLCAALLLLPGLGCTITSEGVQQFDVPVEEIFPPSKTVASYLQLKSPARLKDRELEAQLDGKERLAILEAWSTFGTLAAEYGISGRPPKARVSVTELSSKTDAYGAYSNLRPGGLPEDNYVKIGVHGTLDGERLIFTQDRYLLVVRDLSGAAGPERRNLLINFGVAISARIPRDITDIPLVEYLPLGEPDFGNRVPASEKLHKNDPLELRTLDRGAVTAAYRNQDRECKVFIAEFPTNLESRGALNKLKKIMLKEGKVDELAIGDEGWQGRLLQSSALVARRELVVFGAYGSMTAAEMRGLLAAIDGRVKPYKPAPFKEKPKEKEEEKPKREGGFAPGGEE